MSLTLG